MDYVEDRFIFIVKDEFWNEEEKRWLMTRADGSRSLLPL